MAGTSPAMTRVSKSVTGGLQAANVRPSSSAKADDTSIPENWRSIETPRRTGYPLSRLCENSIARRRRRKFFSTIVLDGDSMLLMHPEMQFEGIVFSAFCARASFHTAWFAGTTGSLALQNLEHAAGHGDAAPVDGDFGGDENEAAGRAHHVRLRDQDLADLAGLDEMRVELHGCECRLAGDEARRHATGAVGEGHQHAALHQAAAVVVLVLGDQRVFVTAVDHALPQRPDQMHEARGLDDFPAVSFELCGGGLVGHSNPVHDLKYTVVSSGADVV